MKKYMTKVQYYIVLILPLALIMSVAQAQDAEHLLPAPTGPFQVGRVTRHWVDESRQETFSEDVDSRREVVVRIWYPVDDVTDVTPLPYFEDFVGSMADQAVAAITSDWSNPVEYYPIPPDPMAPAFPDVIGSITHSFPDRPISDKQSIYPVLIFSSAISMPEEFTYQLEELASHGYIVVGINHPYISHLTILSDRQVIVSTRLAKDEVLVQDIVFVIEQLEKVNADDPEGLFSGRINLEQLGVFGYSGGGDAAVLAGRQDSRIRAVLNLGQRHINVTQLDQPYLYFTSSSETVWSQGPTYAVWCNGFSASASFSDAIVWPEVWIGAKPYLGTMEGLRTVEIVRAYVRAFFDRHLKGEAVALLDGPSAEFPEIEIQVTGQ